MSVNRIASRYAKSLLQLAEEQGQLEAVRADMDTFQSALSHREFYLLLKSPIVHADKKISILNAIFKDRLNPLTMAFLRISVQKGREPYLTEMSGAFIDQYREIKNILSLKVISASPLDEQVRNRIKEQVKASGLASGDIQLETVVNPDLIGGFILELGDKRYDASVSRKLDLLRKEINTKVTL
ncbi:MAG: ATP synthase F1 subunit delta [Saprospiraceae bacterium]|nr:ATP synthase F1 subunit delta [Saprospiraceae bacterium]